LLIWHRIDYQSAAFLNLIRAVISTMIGELALIIGSVLLAIVLAIRGNQLHSRFARYAMARFAEFDKERAASSNWLDTQLPQLLTSQVEALGIGCF
jgi:hypothetical protein